MRQYYRPGMTDDEADALDWENYVLVSAAQAALGVIPTEMKAIFVEASPGRATVHFVVVEGAEDRVREDIEDMLGDLESLLSDADDYRNQLGSVLHVGNIPDHVSTMRWRGLYWAKGWKRDAEIHQ